MFQKILNSSDTRSSAENPMPRSADPRPPARTQRAGDALRAFVDAWGSLGDLFGFSPSTARVSALLLVSSQPLSLGEIAERLGISRGNASMCLKDLRTWGVVRLSAQSGDRRDFYEAEADLWRMFLTIARERKRREFEPSMRGALAALS